LNSDVNRILGTRETMQPSSVTGKLLLLAIQLKSRAKGSVTMLFVQIAA